nr:hypothetical protein [Candidatus Sigynarchaeota archaeon]
MNEWSPLVDLLKELHEAPGDARTWSCEPATIDEPYPFPIKVGKRAWRGAILDEDRLIDLGGKEHGSVCVLLVTTSNEQVHHGKITLFGLDIKDISKSEVDFGMVILISVKEFDAQKVLQLHRRKHFSTEIEGAIERFHPRKYWIRLGTVFRDRSLSFSHLGRAFMKLFMDEHENIIERIEIVFIVDRPETIKHLERIQATVNDTMASLRRERIAGRLKLREGCDFEWECGTCTFQGVCDEVRKIAELRKNERDA